MRTKAVLTTALLLFVAVSIGVAVVREAATRPSRPTAEAGVRAAATAELIVYYLHGKVRCVTCNDIELSAKEAVESGFSPEIRAGRLEWRVVDYDEPGNEHLATDYEIAAPCVVLSSLRDGRQVSWKSLPEVWELIGDKPAFRAFVQKNVREQLERGQNPAPASQPSAAAAPSAPAVTAAKLPRLLDLGAGKCIPCKMMAPVLAELRETYKGRLEVVFLDVWEDPKPAQTYGVSTIPTQIFFDAQGKERFRHEGFFSREEILAKWKELGVDLGSPGRS
jgi:thiol-disulfide isomerase/thioredoxin